MIKSAIEKQWRGSDPIVAISAQGGRLVRDIDWSTINSVKVSDGWLYEEAGPEQVSNGRVSVRIYAPEGFYIFFSHLDKAEAERAAFAMQFLKEECGFKSDSGF